MLAVVATYNRRELLEKSLDALRAQARRPDRVLVVDNASTDGTDAMLAGRQDVEVLRLPENVGGAGAFEAGLRRAHELGFDWYWLLDDDTLPEPRCLAELLSAAARAPHAPSLVTSVVRWKDGSLHPMNTPWLRLRDRSEVVQAAAAGLCPVRATTFVSTMVRREAVERHGFPPGHYYILLDDIEYTARLLRDGHGYIVPASVAYHWTPRAYSTITEARGRFYYKVRNQLWLLRGPSLRGVDRLLHAIGYGGAISVYVRGSRPRREALLTVGRGLRDGILSRRKS